MNKATVAKIINQASVVESKQSGDTLRLWESFREQAHLWRAIALLQVPTTFIAIIFALMIWNTRSITLNVPAKPLPGMYLAQDVPDSEFIDQTTTYINLIATYQPATARRQFAEARKMLMEPILSQFDIEMFGTELKAIESTNRTQIVFIDPTKTRVERQQNHEVKVYMTGERMKMIAGKELEPQITEFSVTLKTIPRNPLNPYGIMIVNVLYKNVDR